MLPTEYKEKYSRTVQIADQMGRQQTASIVPDDRAASEVGCDLMYAMIRQSGIARLSAIASDPPISPSPIKPNV